MARLSLPLLLAALVLLAACGQDPLTEDPAPGAVLLDYTGGLDGLFDAGRFDAAGAPRLDRRGRPAAGPWAVGGPAPRYPDDKWIVVGAAGETVVAITLPRTLGPATFPITHDASVCPTFRVCPQVVVLLGVSPRAPHAGVDGFCTLHEGTVAVTAAASDRVRGTVSGVGTCARTQTETPQPFAIEQGTFDVALSDAYTSGLELY